jgi:hypothetical protein
MSRSPIFPVTNHHTESCGEPPQIDDSAPNCYRGYFENEHGEQAIFVYNRTTRQGTLHLGDAGWDRPCAVVDGTVAGLMLGTSEALWLATCWKAATSR